MKKIILACTLVISLPAFSQKKTQTEQNMEQIGLVRLQNIDPTIQVNLALATSNNFLEKPVYTDLTTAYLHPQAAQALKKAQAALKRMRPDLSLKVFDAARPLLAQAVLYRTVAGTAKNIYISDPRNGGDQHNYGLAVDVTLCNEKGDTLEMGTRIGDFIPLSGIAAEEAEAEKGELSKAALENRQLLRRVMAIGGFKALRNEWWHFNFRTRSEAKANFQILK